MTDTNQNLADTSNGVGLGVSTFYKSSRNPENMTLRLRKVPISYAHQMEYSFSDDSKKLTRKRKTKVSEDVDYDYDAGVKNRRSKKRAAERSRKTGANKHTDSEEDVDSDDSEELENRRPKKRLAEETKMSDYELMIQQNIEEKKRLLLQLDFVKPKPEPKKKEKRIKRVVLYPQSTRVLRGNAPLPNAYNEQDSD